MPIFLVHSLDAFPGFAARKITLHDKSDPGISWISFPWYMSFLETHCSINIKLTIWRFRAGGWQNYSNLLCNHGKSLCITNLTLE
jgi:hypothetical protein